ncbi:MAG: PspC domain-containing protein [Nitrosopumilaceae archaeon]|nr:PspC domain-containing protein [Nitrosopumilaceae archaeon]NIX62446.1 PspC domain-containing protein [Nitrosopumilaceae archaeon]
MKKLYRSKTDQKLAGVIGGIAEYANIDANVLRLLTVLVFFVTGLLPVLITYIVAWIIVPEEAVVDQQMTQAETK